MSTGEQPESQQLAEQLLHLRRIRGLQLQAQIRRVRVGAPDPELLHFKAAVVFDHGVENLLHHVRIDQVAGGLDDFLLHRGKSQDTAAGKNPGQYTQIPISAGLRGNICTRFRFFLLDSKTGGCL